MDWKKKEYWLIISILILTSAYSYTLRYSKVNPNIPVDLESIPLRIGDWSGKSLKIDKEVIEILKSDQSILRKYVNSQGEEVYLYMCYFKDQKYGAQIHSPKHCLPGGGWTILKHERIVLPSTDSIIPEHKVNLLEISNGKIKQMVLYWFATGNTTISSEWMLKLNLIKNALLGKPRDATFIRLSFSLTDEQDINHRSKVLINFAQHLLVNFHNVINDL